MLLIRALLGMDPEDTRKVLRCRDKLRPVFATFHIPLISARVSETQTQTDHKTRHCQKNRAHTQIDLCELRNARYARRPAAQDNEWHDHFRQDAAMHL